MSNGFNVKGNLAVVTGSADGIGKGICYKLAKEGCHLALVDINGDKLRDVEKDLKSLYPLLKIFAFICDVSNEQQIDELVNKVKKSFNTNKIEMLFNNAGVYYSEILYGNTNKLRKTMDINLWSMIYATRAFKYMLLENEKYNKQCYIINTGSISSIITGSNLYSVTKHAVIAFSEAIASEFKRYHPKLNILVSTLAPLIVTTNLEPNSKKQFDDYFLNPFEDKKLYEMTQIDIDECADIVYEAMKNKQTLIPTNTVCHEAVIKDRMESLLSCKPNAGENLKEFFDEVTAKYYIKHYKHLIPSKL